MIHILIFLLIINLCLLVIPKIITYNKIIKKSEKVKYNCKVLFSEE